MRPVDEVRALLQKHSLLDRLPGLIAHWDSIAEGHGDAERALRHASEVDLIHAGFTQSEATHLLASLRASAPLGSSRPSSPEPEPEPQAMPRCSLSLSLSLCVCVCVCVCMTL